MDFNEYQRQAATTAVYHLDDRIIYPALALTSEAGEVAGAVSKWLRDDPGSGVSPQRKQVIVLELGDVLWNLAALATDLGVSLEDVAQANLDKLADRAERGKIKGDGDDR